MYKVKKSPIHGRGLFSTKKIKADTLLGYCKTKPTKKDGAYTLWTEDGPVKVVCDLRFINHSDKPNVAYYDDLSVMTLRDIAPGEELTHNYLQ